MRLQLQSILLPSADVCNIEELYYHRNGKEVRFDGYFNIFYIEKRKVYTKIDNLKLQLTLSGFDKIILMHDETVVCEIQPDDKNAEGSNEYTVDFPYKDYDSGVFWFILTRQEGSTEESVSGCYVTEIPEDKIRSINIGIDICTYKREEYLIRTLRQLKEKVLDDHQLDAASHYIIYVIDNGKTVLDSEEIKQLLEDCSSKLRICYNKNSGGAGGFTKGMLEILNDRDKLGLTHILIMDDDAVLEPDSLGRIYGFLTTLKDKWKDITIGGAMYREDHPYMLYCAGEYWKSGFIYNPAMHTDLREFSNASRPLLTETGHEYEWYSGWWLCCMSLNTVREDNLPLPLFIHHDDIEFGLRNRKTGIVFLNGVGVWHTRPDLVYPGVNRYYDVRNNLIEIALNEKKEKQYITAAKLMFQALTASAIRLRYQDVKLVYKAFRDFIKGPEWLWSQDPEKLNSKVRSMSLQMEPLEDALSELTEKDKESAEKQLEDYIKTHDKDDVIKPLTKNHGGGPLYWFTYNGWILPPDKKKIQLVASTDSPYKGFRKERILLYEPGTGKAKAVVRNRKDMREVLRIYRKTAGLFVRYFTTACKNWRNGVASLTNKEAWERYLNKDIKMPEGGER